MIDVFSLNDYQKATKEYAIYPHIGGQLSLYPLLGLAGEVGELLNKVKKVYRDKDGIVDNKTRKEIALELGDILWYVAQVSETIGYDLSDIAMLNLRKLEHRKQASSITGSGDDR